jgi:hypothetical protein
MSAVIPLTQLDAVNLMLADIGDRPVNSLTGTQRLDVTRAIDTLDSVVRQLCTLGWFFNEELVETSIDGSGHYNVAEDWSKIEYVSGGPTSGTRGAPQYAVRGRKLYDVVNATDTFDAGSPSIRLTIARLLSFEDLPQAAREYAYAAASVTMQSRTLGSRQVDGDLRLRAAQALATLKTEEVDVRVEDTTFSPRFIGLMHRR